MKQPIDKDVAATREALPITLLTGFLGAGKTTLVNRLLTESHDKRLAVIVNEFGALSIDAALITGAYGSVIELANGCICCATQGDLHRALQQLLETRGDLDGVLIETSGLADPGPVIQTLTMFRFMREIRLDGVVTVIDAENFDRNLESAEAAFQQITSADIFLINKVDLVGEEIPGLIEKGLRTLNPTARFLHCVGCDVPLDVMLGYLSQSHEGRQGRGTHRHGSHDGAHHNHDGFQSVSLTVEGPLVPERFDAWLDALPDDVYRAKGFVMFVGMASPVVLHVVGARRSIQTDLLGMGKTKGAAIVAIGRNLAAAELQAGLEGCAA